MLSQIVLHSQTLQFKQTEDLLICVYMSRMQMGLQAVKLHSDFNTILHLFCCGETCAVLHWLLLFKLDACQSFSHPCSHAHTDYEETPTLLSESDVFCKEAWMLGSPHRQKTPGRVLEWKTKPGSPKKINKPLFTNPSVVHFSVENSECWSCSSSVKWLFRLKKRVWHPYDWNFNL